MNCDSVTKLIPLYYYGELTPDEEDHLDQHLHECAGCTRQMAQQRKLASIFEMAQTMQYQQACRTITIICGKIVREVVQG